MKAIRIHQHGSIDVLKVDTIQVPDIKPDEVLVKIHSAALNHLDIFVRQGIPGVPLPLIMGSDGSGSIAAMGSEVEQKASWKQGDQVIHVPIRSCGHCLPCSQNNENLCREFQIPGEHLDGTQAEYMAIPEKYLLPKPATLSFSEAAAFPLAYMTAYHMLTRKISTRQGEWILIYGASSGVGSAAIQIARVLGLNVITTAGSKEKEDLARRLGADFVIQYKSSSVGRSVREITNGAGVDFVFEHPGSATWNDSLKSLKTGGTLVTCGATTGPIVRIDLRSLFIKHQCLVGSTMGTKSDLIELCKLIDNKQLKIATGQSFQPEEIQEAHQHLEQGQHLGKVTLTFSS